MSDDSLAEMLPAPFSAQLLRDTAFVGMQLLYHVESRDEAPHLRLTTYLELDDTHVTFEMERLDTDGNLIDDPIEGTTTWAELADHGSYPRAMTTIHDTVIEVVAGTFDCWLYEVRIVTEDGPGRIRAYFAKERPGPPVRFEQYVGDDLDYLMELIDGFGEEEE